MGITYIKKIITNKFNFFFSETSRKRSVLSVKPFYHHLKCILFRYKQFSLEFVTKLFKIKKFSALF